MAKTTVEIPLSVMEIIVSFTDLMVRVEMFTDQDIDQAFEAIRRIYKGEEQEELVNNLLQILLDSRGES